MKTTIITITNHKSLYDLVIHPTQLTESRKMMIDIANGNTEQAMEHAHNIINTFKMEDW